MARDTFMDAHGYEGDYLERAGFKRPIDQTVPEDYKEKTDTIDRLQESEKQRNELGVDTDTWYTEV